MKRLAVLGLLALLVGCDTEPRQHTIPTEGDRAVACMSMRFGYGVGLSCNWERYNQQYPVVGEDKP